MRRPQFTLRTLLVAMLVMAVGSVALPRPIQAVRRWLWPPETFHCGLGTIGGPIVIVDEEEALLGIPETP